MVTALKIAPQEHPCLVKLCDDRRYLDYAVSEGSDLLLKASALKVEDGIAAIYAFESNLILLPGNRKIGKRIIAGTFYIVGVKDGKLKSLSEEEIIRFTIKYWHPEIYENDEVFDSWISF